MGSCVLVGDRRAVGWLPALPPPSLPSSIDSSLVPPLNPGPSILHKSGQPLLPEVAKRREDACRDEPAATRWSCAAAQAGALGLRKVKVAKEELLPPLSMLSRQHNQEIRHCISGHGSELVATTAWDLSRDAGELLFLAAFNQDSKALYTVIGGGVLPWTMKMLASPKVAIPLLLLQERRASLATNTAIFILRFSVCFSIHLSLVQGKFFVVCKLITHSNQMDAFNS